MTDNDRALLVHLAEQVMGFQNTAPQVWGDGLDVYGPETWHPWNPLTDANDALLLAVKCFASGGLFFQATGFPVGFRFNCESSPAIQGPLVEGATVEAACRAISLACARATGWKG